jgi:hypothetical protein
MARRIPVSAVLAPAGIYRREARAVTGYKASERSRFAVVRASDESIWMLIHIRSGGGLESTLPALPRRLTLADKLAVAAAWDAVTHLDWSAFDDLPAASLEMTAIPSIDLARARHTLAEMRAIAARALA